MIEHAQLTDAQIDEIFNAMPGGVDGWLKSWGYRQFARAVALKAAEAERAAIDEMHDEEDLWAPIGHSSWGEGYQEGWGEGIKAYVEAIRARGTGGEG